MHSLPPYRRSPLASFTTGSPFVFTGVTGPQRPVFIPASDKPPVQTMFPPATVFCFFLFFFKKKAPQTLCQVLIKMIHVFIHFTRWLFIQFWFSEHLKNVFSPRPLVRLPFTARSLHPPVACLASQRYFLLAFLVCSHTQNYAPHASLVLLVPCDPHKYSCAVSLVFEGLRVVKNRSGGKEVLLHMQVMPHTHYQLFWCALTLKNLFLMPFWCFCCAVTLIHSSVLCFLLFSASFL